MMLPFHSTLYITSVIETVSFTNQRINQSSTTSNTRSLNFIN